MDPDSAERRASFIRRQRADNGGTVVDICADTGAFWRAAARAS